MADPIVISEWEVACELYASLFAGPSVDADLDGRPAVRLGLFWNSQVWEPYLDDLRKVPPTQADQVGRLYPASGDEPALVALPGHGDWPKAVDETGLRILGAHGVPVRLDEDRAGGIPWSRIAFVGGVGFGLAFGLFAAFTRQARRRRSVPAR
ncbi:MAG: hypothetical protein M3321_08910 [Actinomycetota bacterium]|nr:hypothetical protein [Actinomycetota bacterium]